MTPVEVEGEIVDGQRKTFVGEGCDDIPGVLFKDGHVLYEFALSDEERAAIAAGQHLRLWLVTQGRPQPVALQVVGVDPPQPAMTHDEKVSFVTARGWHTYYNEKYWVNRDTITDPKVQDYTDYGMNLDDAVKWEQIGRPKHGVSLLGIPVLSQIALAHATKGLTQPITPRGSDAS